MSEDKLSCENCDNDSLVEMVVVAVDEIHVLCPPCREARAEGDYATLNLRRTFLRGDPE